MSPDEPDPPDIPDEITLFPKPIEAENIEVDGDDLKLDIVIDEKDLDDLIERCESLQRLADAIDHGDHIERLAGEDDPCFGEYLL